MAKYDIDGLDRIEKALFKSIKEDYPEELKKLLVQVAYELQGKTKEKTPVDTSRLKDAWKVGKVKKRGKEYYIEVFNNVEYAEPVEFGHRTKAGSYVRGRHMFEISIEEINDRLTPFLKNWIDNFIKKIGL